MAFSDEDLRTFIDEQFDGLAAHAEVFSRWRTTNGVDALRTDSYLAWECSPKDRESYNARMRVYLRSYYKRSYVRARIKAYSDEYRARPGVADRQRAYSLNRSRLPHVRARQNETHREWSRRPDVRARRAAYQRRHDVYAKALERRRARRAAGLEPKRVRTGESLEKHRAASRLRSQAKSMAKLLGVSFELAHRALLDGTLKFESRQGQKPRKPAASPAGWIRPAGKLVGWVERVAA